MVWEVRQDIHGVAALMDSEMDGSILGGYEAEEMQLMIEHRPLPTNLLERLPKVVTLNGTTKNLPDVLGGGWFYASLRFKSILERFEPNKFQYFPVQLRGPNTDETDSSFTYYICYGITGTHDILDLVDIDKSDLAWKDNPFLKPDAVLPHGMNVAPPNAPKRTLIRVQDRDLVFQESKIAGLHFWYCRHPKTKGAYEAQFGTFMSDELMNALEPMTGLERKRHNEIE